MDTFHECRQCSAPDGYTWFADDGYELCRYCGHKRVHADSWVHRGACRGLDTNMFFPERGDTDGLEKARAVCQECPVTQKCLEYALFTVQRFGIWGGKSERERRIIRNGRRGTDGTAFRGFVRTCPNCRTTFRTTIRQKGFCSRACYAQNLKNIHPALRRKRA